MLATNSRTSLRLADPCFAEHRDVARSSGVNGGLELAVEPGQVCEAADKWCFEVTRERLSVRVEANDAIGAT